MRRQILLSGIAVLFLATGTAQAQFGAFWPCIFPTMYRPIFPFLPSAGGFALPARQNRRLNALPDHRPRVQALHELVIRAT
jgi:hypothetical protein